jgi:hypothetical protein
MNRSIFACFNVRPVFEKFYMVVTANRKLRWAHALGTVVVVGQGYVCMIHVGGTRCVTGSIDRIIQIHARITWGVEFIRAIFFIFFLYV